MCLKCLGTLYSAYKIYICLIPLSACNTYAYVSVQAYIDSYVCLHYVCMWASMYVIYVRIYAWTNACICVCMYVCMYVIYVHTFLRAAYPVVLLTDTSNRRCCRGGPIARPPKSPNLKLPDICVRCVQNTLQGNAKMTNCRDFDTTGTGSREESIQIFVVFARVSHGLHVQCTLSGKVLIPCTFTMFSFYPCPNGSYCMYVVRPAHTKL